MRRSSVPTLVIVMYCALFDRRALAFGECAKLNASVALTLEGGLTKAARAAGYVQCVAANDETNYLGDFSGTLKIHQVNPSIDYATPFQGNGEANSSLEAPANYDIKTCYQAFISATSGSTTGSGTSPESCTPDPPPPPHDPITIYDDTGCPQYSNCNSPIVINLGNGAYQLTGSNDPVTFDIDADGTPDHLAWTALGTPMAFLALDRNGNGVIDDGAELFGNHTPLPTGGAAANGFDALTPYDTNGDGVIDAGDSVWPSLLLWTDLNHDGTSQPSEIVSLSASVVTKIGVNYHWSGRRDASGNSFRYQSKVWIETAASHATPRPVYDIYFVAAP